MAREGRYPVDLHELVEFFYLRDVPYGPIARSGDTWISIGDATCGDKKTTCGMVELRSGAKGRGADGSEYRSW